MHEQWQEMLLYYVNGSLSNEERKALERHLAQCADCRAAAEDWRALAQVAKAEVESLKDDLPPLALPGNTRYAPRGPNSPSHRKLDSWEDRKMYLTNVFRLPAQPRRLSVPLTLIVALAFTLLVSGILIFNSTPELSAVLAGLFGPKETPTSIFEQYIDEVWNAGNLDVLDELLAPEFIHYDAGLAEPIADLDAMRAYVEQFRSSLLIGRGMEVSLIEGEEQLLIPWVDAQCLRRFFYFRL